MHERAEHRVHTGAWASCRSRCLEEEEKLLDEQVSSEATLLPKTTSALEKSGFPEQSTRGYSCCHQLECKNGWRIILIHSEFSLFLKPGFGPDVRIPDLRSSPAVPEPFSSSPSSSLPRLAVTHAAITQHRSTPTRTRGLAPSRAELRACLPPPGSLGSAQAISEAVQGEEDKAAKQHFR
ncbi:unnamed protein product [Rangifer tarandus platyrhynchus]|uniref:Uncharacterized protein n=2 Tax=Rangifer tarandus platyrhynchus TaxID=3082113 RepID=A0ABN8Y3H9_RANTA|nr:unnamed protein product [Rangifer tarandus platyrhynchus]CAI9713061.1 unnamed protein product [Rangifer tarandus platyrhynchus]